MKEYKNIKIDAYEDVGGKWYWIIKWSSEHIQESSVGYPDIETSLKEARNIIDIIVKKNQK